jgi:Flp pilus assembly protein TadD
MDDTMSDLMGSLDVYLAGVLSELDRSRQADEVPAAAGADGPPEPPDRAKLDQWLQAAWVAAESDDLPTAARCGYEAWRLCPQDARPWAKLALVFHRAGRTEQAGQLMEEAVWRRLLEGADPAQVERAAQAVGHYRDGFQISQLDTAWGVLFG